MYETHIDQLLFLSNRGDHTAKQDWKNNEQEKIQRETPHSKYHKDKLKSFQDHRLKTVGSICINHFFVVVFSANYVVCFLCVCVCVFFFFFFFFFFVGGGGRIWFVEIKTKTKCH